MGEQERSADVPPARDRDAALRGQVEALRAAGWDLPGIGGADEIAALPVLRKSDLAARQAADPPFGGVPVRGATHVFQSPGPIYEPGAIEGDWWRLGRFLRAMGIGAADTVQNCFAYHLTPAGIMFESAARAVGARVLPAGTGQTELQARAAAHLGATAYAGTPDYLKAILDRADELGLTIPYRAAAVSGGALFPALREGYAARGIDCRQCYATADLGLIAHEDGGEGMAVDPDVILEIVRPGTGDPLPNGEVGEVVVTALTPGYPLIRFATGDLSRRIAPDRIAGWMGRADQTTKIKGMFVRPEQVAALVAAVPGLRRARAVALREGDADALLVRIEGGDPSAVEAVLPEHLKMRGRVEAVPEGGLPNDGIVVEDARDYGAGAD
ncbi:MAG: phenylacetate--CoA ligase family protein [Hasllibacter sp.]